MAALTFVLDGALSADHHLAATPAGGGHYHAHAHSHGHTHTHGPADASDHQLVDGGAVTDSADVAAVHHGSAPVSGLDAGVCCCFCASCAAIVLSCLDAQAVPVLLLRTMATARRRHGDGVVPDGLRRPPRPLAIA